MSDDLFDTPTRPQREPLTKDGKFYTLIDPISGAACRTRVTTWAKTVDDTYWLERWKLRMAIKGLAERVDDLVPLVQSLHVDDDKRQLDRIADQCIEVSKASAGANKGTALHNFTDAVDRGEAIATKIVEWVTDITSYQAAMAAYGYKILPGMVERFVVVPEVNCAGKFDRLVLCPDGVIRILDLKTSKSIDFSWCSIAVQEACYAHASHIWIGSKEEEEKDPTKYIPLPGPIDQKVGLVAHLPVGTGTCTMYGVNIAAGWEASTELCARVRQWRTRKDLAWILEPPQPLSYADRLRAAESVDELHAIFFEASNEGKWTMELTSLATECRGRLKRKVA